MHEKKCRIYRLSYTGNNKHMPTCHLSSSLYLHQGRRLEHYTWSMILCAFQSSRKPHRDRVEDGGEFLPNIHSGGEMLTGEGDAAQC